MLLRSCFLFFNYFSVILHLCVCLKFQSRPVSVSCPSTPRPCLTLLPACVTTWLSLTCHIYCTSNCLHFLLYIYIPPFSLMFLGRLLCSVIQQLLSFCDFKCIDFGLFPDSALPPFSFWYGNFDYLGGLLITTGLNHSAIYSIPFGHCWLETLLAWPCLC